MTHVILTHAQTKEDRHIAFASVDTFTDFIKTIRSFEPNRDWVLHECWTTPEAAESGDEF